MRVEPQPMTVFALPLQTSTAMSAICFLWVMESAKNSPMLPMTINPRMPPAITYSYTLLWAASSMFLSLSKHVMMGQKY